MNYQSFQPNPPGSQPSEQLPVPERKHFLNKKFIVIFVVLVLLGAGSYTGIWWWENRQLCPPGSPCWVMPDDTVYNMDPTANWKTYTNTQYGIEIKYPSVNNDFNPASNIGVSLLDNTQPEPGPGAFWFGLSQKIWHDRLTNKSKYKVGDACSPLGEQETQCTVLSLNPYAILTKVNWAAPVNFQYSLLILTDKFEITIGPLSRDVQNETLNQILSTFKFTSQPVIDSNLKTFVDVKGRFIVQYPSSDAGINLDFPEGYTSSDYRVFGMNNVGPNSPIFYFSIYAKPLSSKDSISLCREAGGGYIRKYDTSGHVMIDGQSYTKCIFDRELQGDKVLHVAFNRGGYTWEFFATYYDRYQKIIDSTISTLEFAK